MNELLKSAGFLLVLIVFGTVIYFIHKYAKRFSFGSLTKSENNPTPDYITKNNINYKRKNIDNTDNKSMFRAIAHQYNQKHDNKIGGTDVKHISSRLKKSEVSEEKKLQIIADHYKRPIRVYFTDSESGVTYTPSEQKHSTEWVILKDNSLNKYDSLTQNA